MSENAQGLKRADPKDEAYEFIMRAKRLDRPTAEAQYSTLINMALERATAQHLSFEEALDSVRKDLSFMVSRSKAAQRNITDTFVVLLADLLFVSVPFIGIAAVFAYVHRIEEIWGVSEWAFAAAILSGQTITKLVSGLLASRTETREPRVTFLITIVLVLGVVPSLLVLVLNVLSLESSRNRELATGGIAAQLIVFVLATVFYLVIGGTGEYMKMTHSQGARESKTDQEA